MRRVLVVQRRMTHYRIPLFNELRRQLAEADIELSVAYGQGSASEREKGDEAALDWGVVLETRYLLNGKLCIQPLEKNMVNVDLLVVTLENKLLCNLWHQYLKTPYRVALWGHGANLQGNPKSLREVVKRRIGRRADWWFGYTDRSLPLIEKCGFPPERVTILNNSIDTVELADRYRQAVLKGEEVIRSQLGLMDAKVGIFLGSLYEEKRIDFLLEAALEIRKLHPNFVLLIAGNGPLRDLVLNFCSRHQWAHYLGVLTGQAKAEALAASDILLNPGLVGLGILDSFVCETPIFTTDCGIHSPEIAYLEPNVNGVITENDIASYVRLVGDAFLDESFQKRLRQGCRLSAEKYSVRGMAKNFVLGLQGCLSSSIVRHSI